MMTASANDVQHEPESETSGLTRREMVRAGSILGASAAIGGTLLVRAKTREVLRDPTGEGTIRHLTVLNNIPAQPQEDLLLRMQRDLVKAMAKPVEQRRWMMVIDTRKCVGCSACTIACVAENHLPPGVVYRPVVTEEFGEFPNVQLRFTPRPCMQCEHPPCTPVCPVNATWKRPDGIVAIDYDKCIGCGYCITACPYNARTRDLGEFYTQGAAEGAEGGSLLGTPAPWEGQPNYEYGKAWDRQKGDSPAGNARKCQFCLHRLEVGQLPQCVTSCIGRATFFGDANDPDALVNELARKANTHRLLEHLGTSPSVIYLT